MSSLAICNVQNVDIELTSKEVPILDGSAKEWVEDADNEYVNEKYAGAKDSTSFLAADHAGEVIKDLIDRKFNSTSVYDYFKVINNLDEFKEYFEQIKRV